MQRTTRNLNVTDRGLEFLKRARRIVREAEDARAELAAHNGAFTGNLKISAPVSFGTLHLGRALYPFLQQHPGIQLNLELNDRFVDAAADGYDAVIRHGAVGDARLIVKRISSSSRHLVASAAYIRQHGQPKNVAELTAHNAILYSNREADWRFRQKNRWVVVRPSRYLRVNNGLIMRDAAVAGLGITLLPNFLTHTELACGTLRIIDIGLDAESAEIFVAYPTSRSPSAKLRALIEHLRLSFGTPPYWELWSKQRRRFNAPPAATRP